VIRLTGTVTYRDGHTDQVEVTQAEYAAYELWCLRMGLDPAPDKAAPMVMTRYLAYAASQHAAHLEPGAWRTFEAWGYDVADVELDAPPEAVDAQAPPFPVDRLAG
jgi:hypothetical protein